MLKISTIRSLITRGLRSSTGKTTIVAEQGAPQPPYPFISVKFTVPGRKVGRSAEYMRGAQQVVEQDFEMVLSVSCISNTLDGASDLAFEALEYFEIHGVIPLRDNRVVIAQTTDITDRTTFLTTDYEYRMGFDVRLRVRTQVLVDVDIIESVEFDVEIKK